MNGTTTDREFEVVAPDLRKAWLLPGLGLLAAAIGLAFAARQDPAVLLTLPFLLLAVAVIAIVVRRRSVRIDGGVLHVAAGMHNGRVAVADLVLGRIDPRINPALRSSSRWFDSQRFD